MLVKNKLTEPGGIRRVDLESETVRIVLQDGTERIYVNERSKELSLSDYGALDALADTTSDR